MNEFAKSRVGSGTREWSEYSLNVGTGCRNKCRYCYATANAMRYKVIQSRDEWENEKVNDAALSRYIGKKDGVIMFPTTHDITPTYLEASKQILIKALKKGNQLLIVSKPRIDCIIPLLYELEPYKEQILFRFTIGTLSNELSLLWEPGAPLPNERIGCLEAAYNHGFKTSVSMEPMLAGTEDALKTFYTVAEFVTETIWIGKMNKIDQRVLIAEPHISQAVSEIKQLQSDGEVMRLYAELCGNPKIEWKESIKAVIGL